MSKLEAGIRGNWRKSENLENGLSYWFLIIGPGTREISAVESRIYKALQPIQNQEPTIEGNFRGKGLMYRLLHFESQKSEKMLRENGINLRIDARLYDREDPEGLEKYVLSLAK